MSVTYFVFSGTFHKGTSSTVETGHARITATVPLVKDTSGDIVFTGSIKAELNDQGKFSVALVNPSSSDLDPTGFGYTVQMRLSGGSLDPVTFAVAADASTLDYSDLVSVDPPDPIYRVSSGGGNWGDE